MEHGVFGRQEMMWCSMGVLLELIELSLHGRKLKFGAEFQNGDVPRLKNSPNFY